jgi:hypothetical protein
MKAITLVACGAIVACLLFASCGDDDSTAPTAPHFQAAQYAGTYTGTWANTATGQSGPATIAIAIDESARTASLTIDFGGNYLGLGDPPPATLSGVFDDQKATVKGTSDLFGDYDVTIDANGHIDGLMLNLGGGLIPRMSYTGTLTKSTLDADYKVTLKDNTVANSTLRMTK